MLSVMEEDERAEGGLLKSPETEAGGGVAVLLEFESFFWVRRLGKSTYGLGIFFYKFI